MIYKVSYVVVDRSEVGGIINQETAPEVGDQLKLGDTLVEVEEVIDLMPPRGDFAYLHATCHTVDAG
jgi:hypothetical protein